jgi:hypothetical protein
VGTIIFTLAPSPNFSVSALYHLNVFTEALVGLFIANLETKPFNFLIALSAIDSTSFFASSKSFSLVSNVS